MDNFIIYIYRNPNVNFQFKDNSLLNLDRERSIYVGIIQNKNNLSNRVEIKNQYNLSSFEFKQDNLWNLIHKRGKYKISILKIRFKFMLETEDQENLDLFLNGDLTITELKTNIESYTEIDEIKFRYRGKAYSVKSTGVMGVITDRSTLEKDLLVPPILDLFGLKSNERSGEII